MSKLNVTIDSYLWVKNGPTELYSTLKKELSFANPAYESAVRHGRSTWNIPKKIRLYEEIDGTIRLPRGYWDRLSHLVEFFGLKPEYINKTLEFDPVYPSKKIELYQYQDPWVDSLLESPQGVGVGCCGSGKTTMALEVYARLGQPCLWITHTKRLAQQAMARASQFLGVTPGIIGIGKERIEHFTVGLVPTLIKRDLSKYTDKFGLVITDECHHVPAITMFQVVSSFPAKYRYGLTATPYRDDGLGRVIFETFGPELASLDKQHLRAEGKLMASEVKRRTTNFYFPYDPSSRKSNYDALSKALAGSYQRNLKIAGDVIVESTLDEKNVCIVLVGRIEHGNDLLNIIQPIIPDTAFVHSKLPAKQVDAGLDDFESGKIRILIATYKMLAEGFDYQPSNRLFLTAPFKGRTLIEQACGRIERVYPGKVDAIVYDYVDVEVGVLNRQSEVRMDIYEANDNPVTTVT